MILASFLCSSLVSATPVQEIAVPIETYTLPNGMTVTLHEDHSLPKVVINTWFAVGSKDESVGRTGFAHLFEHLMFMGTGRVPDDQFDVIMEAGGGSNNASTSNDRTNYFSMGPSSLLPTLLWLDADRLDQLPDFMTQEKLDRQRAVVRNERRQNVENVPYGAARLLIPEQLYPAGHPYHHSVIGSHEDLEAATLQDVIDFFHKFYVPSNASLVVTGDFDSAEVKPIIESTFGAIPAKPTPEHRSAEPIVLTSEKKVTATDVVRYPRLYLAWHSPAFYTDGDGAMDLIAGVLAGGPSTRLEKRLVFETGLAQDVAAFQGSRELGSTFQIQATAVEGADLDAIKREILAVIDEFVKEGPTPDELARVQVQTEAGFLRGMESLQRRADSMNAYLRHFGVADGFQRDLDRWIKATPEDLKIWAGRVFGPGRVDLRVFPAEMEKPDSASPLDIRPANFKSTNFRLSMPQSFELSNGIKVHAMPRPGKHLFAGSAIVAGGEALIGRDQAGLSSLLARTLESGAGGLDASSFADAVESLGGSIGASADTKTTRVSVSGLTSRMGQTLDRFADVILRPNLTAKDFERERELTLSSIRAREDNPQAVAGLVSRALTYGRDDPRGRPTDGFVETVEKLSLDHVKRAKDVLLHPKNTQFVFVGDFDPSVLQRELEARFGSWSVAAGPRVALLEPLTKPEPGRIVLFDRPGAPQTVISISRPVKEEDALLRAARDCVDTVFGGTFTSRLNSNLRERNGYTYGARSRIQQSGDQFLLTASSAVRTDVTGASLTEFRNEFQTMAMGGIDGSELNKAVETRRRRLVETAETTSGLARTISGLVVNGRPMNALTSDLTALGEVSMREANHIAGSGLFAWKDLQIVLVGDKNVVVPQLVEAGFGEPIEVDLNGDVKGK